MKVSVTLAVALNHLYVNERRENVTAAIGRTSTNERRSGKPGRLFAFGEQVRRSCPRYLWPQEHQRDNLPFRDGEVMEAAQKAIEPYAHLPLDEALKKIREDREASDAKDD